MKPAFQGKSNDNTLHWKVEIISLIDLPKVFICKIQSYFFLLCMSYLCFFQNHCFLFKQYFMDGKKCAELAFRQL